MIIENPNEIQKAEILVGIPSYNEESTIGFVAEQISRGLSQHFPDKISAIVNVDNYSSDGTKEAFLNSEGQIPKIYISTRPSFKGKGYNLYNFFLMMQKMEAKVGIVFDADLKSIKPDWVKKMADPIIEGYQFIAPYYMRLENEATITNHLAYPLVYGLIGQDLRQPIGGDFSFSDEMVDWWLDQKWTESAYTFGIDIFMSLNALLSQGKCGQVNLGMKIHRITKSAGLDRMFGQVTEAMFKIILENSYELKKKQEVEEIPILGGREMLDMADLQPNYDTYKQIFFDRFKFNAPSLKGMMSKQVYSQLKEIHQGRRLLINADLWSKIVYDFIAAYDSFGQDFSIIENLKCLYFGRLASFFEETAKFTPIQSERELIAQAELFFANRDYLLDRQKQ